jgi:TRAP-type uncharacterized transport system substrate-binding protein
LQPFPQTPFRGQIMSMIANLYPDTYHLIARRDSGIKSVRDLAGKQVGLPSLTSSEYRSFWYIIDQYTIQPERFTARTYQHERRHRCVAQPRSGRDVRHARARQPPPQMAR